MCLPISWLVVGCFGYYLVKTFVRLKSSVWVGVAGSGCGVTRLLCIAHCIDCMNKRARDIFAVELVGKQSYHSGTEGKLF